ncbi:hypothetical protein ACSNN7_01060 [Micromonospora sp. URMC 105]|uniref:hypothetical protein n=1 Tax=Micromonospora sp. URMC 105 TaxID=3423413 RepID=UPI003F1D2999
MTTTVPPEASASSGPAICFPAIAAVGVRRLLRSEIPAFQVHVWALPVVSRAVARSSMSRVGSVGAEEDDVDVAPARRVEAASFLVNGSATLG